MAELIVSVVVVPIVENVISTIASLIKERVALVQGLRTDAEKLSSRLTSIQAVLKEAEKTQLENLLLRDWLAKLKNATLYAEDVLDTLATKAALSNRRQAVHNIGHQQDAALKIKEILARIDYINEEKNQFDLKIESDGGSSQEESQTSGFVDTDDVCDVEQSVVLSIAENSENLRTLLFHRKYLKNFGDQVLEGLFHKLKYLRMLDLSNSTLSVLPSSIEELKLLRYLNLSKTDIKVLPNSICNLYNLQTLKLLGCLWLSKLPKDLGNLVNLRNLELEDMFWFKSSTLLPRIGNLTGLQNLHAFQVGRKSGYGIEELKNMAYLTGTLHISKLENAVNAGDAKLNEKKNLDKLVLEWSIRGVNPKDVSDDEKLLKDLQPHSILTELQILNYMGNNFPNWITSGQLQNLQTLTLNGCTGCRILSLAQIPHLCILNIKRMPELEKWSDETCLSLYRLKISCCDKLSELPQHLLNVEDMKIKKCFSLKSLPVTPSLKFLILDDNPILEDFNEQVVHNSTEPQSTLGDLLEMKIINCPKLQALPEFFAPQKLEISGCELMTGLAIPDLSQRLQHLALNGCQDETLVRAIPDSSSMYSLVISNISNLISFTRWPNLPGLKALYISNCKDLVSLSGEGSLISFSSLELLSIRGCSKLESLPDEGLPTELKCLIIVSCSSLKSLGTKGALKSLNSLKDLHIDDCPLLLSFPEDGLPTSLQHLHIQDCPSLTQQCGTEDAQGPEWPKIRNIPDREILIHISQRRKLGIFHSIAVEKKWIDNKSGCHCFMLYSRSLYITWGHSQYWTWNCFKETSDDNIEVAKLSHVCWLDVRGKFRISDLSPGIVYEVVYVVKLTKGASGWEFPITLRLSLPSGEVRDRQVSLLEKPRGKWIELNVGNFLTRTGETREVCFDIYQHGGHWKTGLIIRGAILRPQHHSTP
ncbi:hypothetical protein EZV62_007753 [Acer yangbiense]|uniref:Uncharacterized protein n=1 Tax=Acer yangbiense TaxID=1000413 RepID=A0A5C7IBE4_9ROSI|nr:hypothetical protein EZV62_007753 [Acer yangbiense]